MFRDILIPKGLGSRKQVSNLRKNTTNSMFSFHIITHFFLLSLLIFSLTILITVTYIEDITRRPEKHNTF